MDVRRMGISFLRGLLVAVLTAVQYAVFFVLMFLRPVVKMVIGLYMLMVPLLFLIGFFLKPEIPVMAYVVNGVCWFLAAFLSWKYDELLQWLAPDGRTLFFDV